MGTRVGGWVVCEGATRLVVDARVACPRRGSVTAAECLGCHLLVTSSAERSGRAWCLAEPPDAEPAMQSGSASHGQDERVAAGLG